VKYISIKLGISVMLNQSGGLLELIFSIGHDDNILLKNGEMKQLGDKIMSLKEREKNMSE
jgi:hypothetical protein